MSRILPVQCEPQNILLNKYIKSEHDNVQECNIKHEHIDESTDYDGYYNQSIYRCYTKDSENTKENVEVQIKTEVDVIDDVKFESLFMRYNNYMSIIAPTTYCNINSHVEKEHTNFNLNIKSSTATLATTKHKVTKFKKNYQIKNEVDPIEDAIFESFVSRDNNNMSSVESKTHDIKSRHIEIKPTNFNLNIKSSTETLAPIKYKVIKLKKNYQIKNEVDTAIEDAVYDIIKSPVQIDPRNVNLNIIKSSTPTFTPTKLKAIKSKKNSKKLNECFICHKFFSSKGNMKTHFMIHTGEKPYQCFICNKSFTQASTLSTHKIIHKFHKPFNCDICKKSFAQKAQITKHMNMRHCYD